MEHLCCSKGTSASTQCVMLQWEIPADVPLDKDLQAAQCLWEFSEISEIVFKRNNFNLLSFSGSLRHPAWKTDVSAHRILEQVLCFSRLNCTNGAGSKREQRGKVSSHPTKEKKMSVAKLSLWICSRGPAN